MAKEDAQDQVVDAISELVINQQVDLDVKLTIDNIADMRAVEIEDALLAQKAELQGKNRQAESEHADLEKSLTKMAEALAAGHEDASATALAKAATAFDNVTYRVAKSATNVDIEKQKVTIGLRLEEDEANENRRHAYTGEFTRVSKSVTVPFTDEMKATIAKMQTASETRKKVQEELRVNANMLADLPRMARRAQGEITKLVLAGEKISGQKILESMKQIDSPKLLPSR